MASWEFPKPSDGILKVKTTFMIILRHCLCQSVNICSDGTEAMMNKTAGA